jgi:VCBS repeat-containing protein
LTQLAGFDKTLEADTVGTIQDFDSLSNKMKKHDSMMFASHARVTPRRRRNQTPNGRAGQRRRLAAETLETRALLAASELLTLHNTARPTDVNADGYTSPVDALYVINELNDGGARALGAGKLLQGGGGRLFYDVNHDQYLSPVDAMLVLNRLNAEGEDDDLVQIRLAATDASGNPIDTVDRGETFELRVFVQDLTGRDNGGVFAAYLDIEFDPGLVSVDGGIGAVIQGPSYDDNVFAGDLDTAGLMNEFGTFDGTSPLGPNELLLFRVPMTADAAGTVNFVPDPADLTPAHYVLVYGTPPGQANGIIAPEDIAFVPATLTIISDVVHQAVNDEYDVQEGTTLIIGADEGVLANDINPGPGDLVASLESNVAHGQLNLAANGSFSYTPEAGFVGTDTFTYVALLGDVPSNVATVTIDVLGVNTPPVAQDDDYSTDEDVPLTIAAPGVLGNDTDDDGDSLTAVLTTDAVHGSVVLQSDGSFTYTPDDDFNGIDSFQYVANDGTVDSEVATVTITVDPVNDRPVAVDDDYAAALNQPLVVAAVDGVLINDTDADDDPLTAVLLTNPSHGTVQLAPDGSFTYTAATDYVGLDSFTYAANDGTVDSAPATVTITVAGPSRVKIRLETANLANQAISSIGPGGEFLLKAYVEDVSAVPRDGVFAAYLDVMYDDTLVSVSGAIVYGEKYPNQPSGNTSVPGLIDEVGAFDGTKFLGAGEFLLFSIPMTADAEGVAVFTGDPADQRPAHDVLLFGTSQAVPPDEVDYGTVELEIEAGEAPVAVDDDYETDEDTPLSVSAQDGVLANDTDVDSETLFATLVSQPLHGSVTLDPDGSFDYVPAANFFGTDTFTYRASDGAQTSNLATVSITVNPVEDAPVAVDDTYLVEDLGSLVVDAQNGVLSNDIEVDGEPMTAMLVADVQNGTLQLNADGSFTYTPDDGFVGRDTFTYKAIANDVASNVAEVTIDVGNLAPSTIQGFVYADTDNNGRLDAGEGRYGGVQISLRGADLFGRPVALDTVTLGDGSYRFDGILRGNYTVTEFQPRGLVDGKDTVGDQRASRNDRFEIDLPAATVAGDYNFGERSLMPEFVRDPSFFASRNSHRLLAMINHSGQMEWYSLGDGWTGLATVDVALSANHASAAVTVTDALGGTDTEQIALNRTRDARLTNPTESGYLLRLEGDPEHFGLVPEGGEASLDARSVDAAFAGPDA